MRPPLPACAAIAWLVAACAGSLPEGRDFPRAAFAAIRLRQTTEQQAEALLGAPYKRLFLQTTPPAPYSGGPISIAILSYTYAPAPADAGGRSADKRAALIFIGGRLAAYDLNSTIPGDANPPIDDRRVAVLRQGITTRNDVIRLMGTPSGQAIPLPGQPHSLGNLFYVWSETGAASVRHRLLTITFDSRDVMTRYALIDETGPPHAPAPLPMMPGLPPPATPPLTTRT